MQITRTSFDTDELSSCIHKLLIVSQIRERDRLRTNQEFSVDSADGHFQSLRRWVQSESRKTMSIALTSLYQEATGLCKIVMETRDMYPNDTIEHARYKMQASSLYDCISRSATGLMNLKTTYKNDRTTSMRLEMLIDNVYNDLKLLQLVDQGTLHPAASHDTIIHSASVTNAPVTPGQATLAPAMPVQATLAPATPVQTTPIQAMPVPVTPVPDLPTITDGHEATYNSQCTTNTTVSQ